MTESIERLHDELIDYLKDGKFAEGIETFYAENATAQENNKPISTGRAQMAADERVFLEKVTAFHGIDILGTAIQDEGNGSGTVFYEAVMRWTQRDVGEVTVQQAGVERWSHGKVQSIRFYGDFDPGTN